MKIADVEGIGAAHAEQLSAAGVMTDEDLLTRGATRAGRLRLAAATGIGEETLLAWIRRIELLRLDGVGPEHVRLLVAAGVDGTLELARRDARRLAETLAELSRTRAVVRQCARCRHDRGMDRGRPGRGSRRGLVLVSDRRAPR